MELSPNMREALNKEIRFAVANIKKSPIPAEKIYYFSAIYAIIDRIYNFECDPELIFIHQVIRQAFDTINGKFAISVPRSPGLGLMVPENLFDKLCDSLSELADTIEKDQPTYTVLQDIANIGYSSTGNGFYLYQKGMLKL
jgi:hypothetical protein